MTFLLRSPVFLFEIPEVPSLVIRNLVSFLLVSPIHPPITETCFLAFPIPSIFPNPFFEGGGMGPAKHAWPFSHRADTPTFLFCLLPIVSNLLVLLWFEFRPCCMLYKRFLQQPLILPCDVWRFCASLLNTLP